MKNFIKQKLREGMDIATPSFNMPVKSEVTPEDIQALRNITWKDISLDEKGGDGVNIIDLGVSFSNPELNKFSDAIVFSIQLINNKQGTTYYQRNGLAPKIYKAFIMDFGHLFSSNGRRQSQHISKVLDVLRNDPEIEGFRNKKGTLLIKKGNPQKQELLNIKNP